MLLQPSWLGKASYVSLVYVFGVKPLLAFLRWNHSLNKAIEECCPFLCWKLVSGWLDLVRIIYASKYWVHDIVICEQLALPLMVFWLQCPDIKQDIISEANPTGSLTNPDSDLAAVALHFFFIDMLVGISMINMWCSTVTTGQVHTGCR
jgi:hypothetical protein